jgi:hypothetical protein
MNSFPEWLKVVLAVAMLALLVWGVSFYLVGKRRGLRNAGNHFKIITALKANPIVRQRVGYLPTSWFLSNIVKREFEAEGTNP